jgi:ketosteroid isomerase-like protein
MQEPDMADFAVEFARRGYEAFNEGGVDAILNFLEPDIEWVAMMPAPISGTYRGHEGVRKFFETLYADWEGVQIDPEEIIPVGDRYVLVFLRIWARGKTSGVGGDAPVAMLWTVGRTGAAQVRIYNDRREALKAAGLDEEPA